MKINLPGVKDQKKIIFKESVNEAIAILKNNLNAPIFPPQDEINESAYSNEHLLREREGWKAPHPDIVGAYFRHFQKYFPDYNTDKKLAELLGVTSDRRVREFKHGDRSVPYGVWRKFMVITGRAPQDILNVLGYMN